VNFFAKKDKKLFKLTILISNHGAKIRKPSNSRRFILEIFMGIKFDYRRIHLKVNKWMFLHDFYRFI
jgi:hypothetical protein